ncbi:MAG: ABC transporter ATP-binding protein [Chloroflexota bacterium]|nr:MAG: ABC transporter ATP-binding protein [Chloroflexota bacterium]
MSDVAVSVEGLGKLYRLGGDSAAYQTLREMVANIVGGSIRGVSRAIGGTAVEAEDRRDLWALKDVSFELKKGRVLGVVGRNGAGKSTLLKILSRITAPTAGRAVVDGRVGALLEVGTGFHPELTGRENIYLNGAILGMTRADIRRRFDEIVDFSGLERFLDTPVKRYSSGMYTRLAFSVAAHLEPEILVVDEVLSVGDVEFQRKSMGKASEAASSGRTVIFVSHNLAALRGLSTDGILLQKGQIVAAGEIGRVLDRYVELIAAAASETSLADRLDRTGSGEIRYLGFRIEDAEGRPTEFARTGDESRFIFDVVNTTGRSLENISFYLLFHDSGGVPLYNHSNLYSGEDLVVPPGRSEVICRVPRLPLTGGTYPIDIAAMVGGTYLDMMTAAAYVQVGEGNFYGTGRQPPLPFHTLIDAGWSLNNGSERR